MLMIEETATRDMEQSGDLMAAIVRDLVINNSAEWLNLDLTFQQLKVLYTLKQHGSLPMARLADALMPRVSMPTITGIITRLIERRDGVPLVERESSPDDRRIVRARLTPAGHAMVERIATPNAEMLNSALARMGDHERAALSANLSRFLAALNESR